jgi:hypothetical protein
MQKKQHSRLHHSGKSQSRVTDLASGWTVIMDIKIIGETGWGKSRREPGVVVHASNPQEPEAGGE